MKTTWWNARWKKNVPFSRDQCEFFERRSQFFRWNRATCWNRGDSTTSIWNQQESQCWTDSWQKRATCHWHSCSTRRPSNISWGRNAQHWRWNTSWKNKDRHGLQNSRTTTFRCATRAKYQRSTIDSENWKPPKSTCSSTRSTTE